MSSYRRAPAALLPALFTLVLSATADASPPVAASGGIRFDGVGLIVANGWAVELLPSLPTTVWIGAGFGFEPESASAADTLWALAEVGTEQALRAAENGAQFVGFGAHRILHRSGIEEGEERLLHYSLLLGAAWRGVEARPGGVRAGSSVELSAEIAPAWTINSTTGEASFSRYNAAATGYLPIARASYVAFHAEADYAHGEAIPRHILASFGGRERAPAPAGAVRGHETGRFAAELKLVGSMEIRRPLWRTVATVAGGFAHIDGGLAWSPADRLPLAIGSVGAGAYLSFGPAVDLIVSTHVVAPPRLDGSRWLPLAIALGFPF